MIKKILKISLLLFIFGILILPNFVLARVECPSGEYSLERPILGLTCAKGPADYIEKIYPIGLGLGVFAAGAMIVYAGITYTLARDDVNKRQESRNKIYAALFGAGLLLGSVFILTIINPDLADPKKWQDNISLTEVAKYEGDPTTKCGNFEDAHRKCMANCLKTKTQDQCLTTVIRKECISFTTEGICRGWRDVYFYSGDCLTTQKAWVNCEAS